jgi:hypothetical protein
MNVVEIGQLSFVPGTMTVQSLSRLGGPEFSAVMEWVAGQRARREERQVELDAAAREAAQVVLADVAERHAATEEWSRRNL